MALADHNHGHGNDNAFMQICRWAFHSDDFSKRLARTIMAIVSLMTLVLAIYITVSAAL